MYLTLITIIWGDSNSSLVPKNPLILNSAEFPALDAIKAQLKGCAFEIKVKNNAGETVLSNLELA